MIEIKISNPSNHHSNKWKKKIIPEIGTPDAALRDEAYRTSTNKPHYRFVHEKH